MWHLDPWLGYDREVGDCTVVVVRQRPASNRGMVFTTRSAKQQLNSKRVAAFSVRSVPRCCKQDN
jgi:hypothetical protein